MKKLIIFTIAIALIILFFTSHHAFASDNQICVFQENAPGVGNFMFLEAIEVFDRSSESAAEVYSYADPLGASYNGSDPPAIPDTSQLFVVKTNNGVGVSLFIVHDQPYDGDGGRSDMQLNLSGDTIDVLVRDDPVNTVTVSGGGTQVISNHIWHPCCTDGFVVGTLEGNWIMDVQFIQNEPFAPEDGDGITAWQAMSADGSMIPLALELGRRVRLQQCAIEVPVDIKPGSCPNPFKLPQDIVDLQGQLPVAILGTEALDVMCIAPQSIKISRECEGCEPIPPIRWAYEDVETPVEGELCECHELGPDGYLDLKLKFRRKALAKEMELYDVVGETIPLTITGELREECGGTPFSGQDCLKVKMKRY